MSAPCRCVCLCLKGARVLALLLRKYSGGLRWRLLLHPRPHVLPPLDVMDTSTGATADAAPSAASPGAHAGGVSDGRASDAYAPGSTQAYARLQRLAAAAAHTAHGPVLCFLLSVLDVVHGQLVVAGQDLLTACKSSFVHGPLLLLRWGSACMCACRQGLLGVLWGFHSVLV